MNNNINTSLLASTVLALSLASTTIQAKVDQAEADKLGGPELTNSGAERAGNAAGTIPEYDGGMSKPPACYDGSTWLCNPFADEKPKFVITADNASEHADKLSPGQLAMFKQYPDSYRIPVYPTHRTSALPDRIAKITKENALKTTLKGDSGLTDYSIQGFPFPIPSNGLEVIWNHVMRWRGDSVERILGQVTPQVNGKYSMVMFRIAGFHQFTHGRGLADGIQIQKPLVVQL